jgi:lysophospholipase L1-like esterase
MWCSLGVGLLALGGCADDGPRQDVALIGDSITTLVDDDLRDISPSRFHLEVRATNGATAGEMLASVQDLRGAAMEQAIVNVGTNDVIKAIPLEETTAAIDGLIALFQEATCIHLTTVSEHIVSLEDPSVQDRAAAINEHLRQLAEGDERIHLIDWSGYVAEYFDAGEPDGSLLTDTVHPTELGQDRLRAQYIDALRSCPT